ncbi:MAG: fumarate hydratase C-terminal domain-containing protein, partial [Candidatus Micrarchaeota archaeon]
MKTFYLKTPLEKYEMKKLKRGDIVYLSGVVFTARDMAHKRIVEYIKRGRQIPFSLDGAALFHAGPIVKNGKIIAIGSTTSARMDGYAPLVFGLGVRALIGKGGMGKGGSA